MMVQAQQALIELQHQNDELTALLDKTAQQVNAGTHWHTHSLAFLLVMRDCSVRMRSSGCIASRP